MNQFSRLEMLIGEESLKRLHASRVAVFGVGGVGGHAAEALIRCGVGAIDVFDSDVVCITNINRQIIATHSTVGRDKVTVMRERLLDINPNAAVGAHKIFFSPETILDFSCYNYIVDAIDTVTAKIELIMRAQQAHIPIISSMGAANKMNPAAFKVADIYKTSVCPLARVMRKELKERGVASLKVVYSEETPICRQQPPASNAFVPPVAGLIIAGEVVKDLCSKTF